MKLARLSHVPRAGSTSYRLGVGRRSEAQRLAIWAVRNRTGPDALPAQLINPILAIAEICNQAILEVEPVLHLGNQVGHGVTTADPLRGVCDVVSFESSKD